MVANRWPDSADFGNRVVDLRVDDHRAPLAERRRLQNMSRLLLSRIGGSLEVPIEWCIGRPAVKPGCGSEWERGIRDVQTSEGWNRPPNRHDGLSRNAFDVERETIRTAADFRS